ncbi:MAG TPA: DoxX family protein [Rhizomicrobium sp.]|nr:DoxX family protein [Rhizomicrobium sp.]
MSLTNLFGKNFLTQARVAEAHWAPYALWALRLAIGAMFLQHVMRMVFGYEPADSSQLFALPPGISPFAVAWETGIGLALIYGLWPRVAAVAGAATLTIATTAAHGVTASPYGWQAPVLWIAALLTFALAGDGAFVLVPSRSGSRTGSRQ